MRQVLAQYALRKATRPVFSAIWFLSGFGFWPFRLCTVGTGSTVQTDTWSVPWPLQSKCPTLTRGSSHGPVAETPRPNARLPSYSPPIHTLFTHWPYGHSPLPPLSTSAPPAHPSTRLPIHLSNCPPVSHPATHPPTWRYFYPSNSTTHPSIPAPLAHQEIKQRLLQRASP